MKSKIQTNQILKKGISIFILLIMIFSMFSTVLVSYADNETDEDPDDAESEIIVGNDEDLSSTEELEHEELKTELDEILNRLTKLEENAANKYLEFAEKVKSSSVISINNEMELRYLSAYINEGNSCAGKTFNITRNIELNSTIEWEPIGSTSNKFTGTLNGNGYTISGMTISTKRSYAGLVGYLGPSGVVKNITISNSNINIEPNIDGLYNDLTSSKRVNYGYLGAVVGYSLGGTITNCINKANVSGGNYVGGIVGYAKNYVSGGKLVNAAIVNDCVNTGAIKGFALVGGIAGVIKGENKKDGSYTIAHTARIERCINKGTVYGVIIDVGGIVGVVTDYARIQDSINQGNVSTTIKKINLTVLGKEEKDIVPQNVGGIAGTAVGKGYDHSTIDVETRILGCINEENAAISGYKDVGGIVGQLGANEGGHSVAYHCISYSNKLSIAEVYNSYDYSKGQIKPVGVIAGNLGGKNYSNYQGGRVYNCYYYGPNENFDSTNLQKNGAIGRVNGSSNAVEGNKAFRITKEGGKYLWQGRVYEDGKIDGKTAYYYSNGTWHYAKKDNNKWLVQEGINGVVTENQYPNYTNNSGFVPVKSTSGGVNRANYQPWLKRLIENFTIDSNGKAVVDNQQPEINKLEIKSSTGNAIAIKGDTILFNVKFGENIHNNGVVPTLTFKIGSTTYTSTYVGNNNNIVTFKYILKGTEEGSINTFSITRNNLEDVFANKANVTIDASVIDSKISMVLKNNNQVSKDVGKQNKDTSNNNTWGISYNISGGRFVNDTIYLNSTQQLKVEATIDHKMTNGMNTTEQPILKVKVGNTTIELPYKSVTESNNITKIIYEGKVELDGEVKEIFLQTSNAVTLTNKNTYNVTLSSSNTKATVGGIIIDNIAPMPDSINISSKQNYGVGEKIIFEATFSEGLDINNIPRLEVKFNDVAGKNNGGIVNAGNVRTESNKTIVTYDYTVTQGDNGKLSIKFNGTIKDIAGNETNLNNIQYNITEEKYADTTVPTVSITGKEVEDTIKSEILNNTTKASEIEYTFDWSEEVSGFTLDDVTINGGTVKTGATLIQDTTDTTKYTLVVVPSIAQGNEGELEVLVEAGVCEDVVNLNNIRSASKVTVDKKAPRLADYEVVKSADGTTITIKAIFDEAIETVAVSDLEIKFGQQQANGEVVSATIDENDKRIVTYVYNISGADDGNPTIVLKADTVKDVAGNSNNIVSTLNNDIELEKHIIKGSDGKEYSFSYKKGNSAYESILDFDIPTYLKAGDKLKVIVDGTTNYEYSVVAGDNGHMSKMIITAAQGSVPASVRFSSTGNGIDIGDANIYFDTIYPIIQSEVYPEEKQPTEIYQKGDKVIIKITTSEKILSEKIIPEVQVNFSNSGKGKYNYESDNKVGFAKFEKEELDQDGKTILYYEYTIQNGDEGEISINLESGRISDLAGNQTNIKELYIAKEPTNAYSVKNEFGSDISISNVEFFKNQSCEVEDKIEAIEATKQTGDLYIKVTLSDGLYTAINTPIVKTNAPIMKLNGEIETEIDSVSGNGRVIVYKYDKEEISYLTSIEYITLINNANTTIYPGEDNISAGERMQNGAKYNYDTPDFEVDPRDIENSISCENIIADTVDPTVIITAANGNNVINNSITNANELIYTFDWSEEVTGFTLEDVTINGGTVKTGTGLVQDTTDKTKYTLVVVANVSEGNVGEIQVIVEKNACQDIVGHKNIRTESIITIDKQAPIFIGLESYAESIIALDSNVDTVKQYYKAGDIVKIVATFTESIESSSVPTLNLQFSESGNAKGDISEGIKAGNKIIYTYTVTNEDSGILSVKGFSGVAIDAAGNQTKVTKRALDGDTIIADTKAPKLNELKIVSPSSGTYNAGNTIKIEAIYDEEIYSLENNAIKLVTPENAPLLKLKFGNGTERTAIAVGYGKTDGKEDRTKLEYIYTIVDGDNGELTLNSYINKSNHEVSDIAGNQATLVVDQQGNKIIADTVRPEVRNITATVEDPTILNTGIYHKEGNTVKITLTFSEKVNSKVIMPQILIGFSEDESVEPTEYTTYAYESNWNVNSTTVEYSYRIKEGDNGYLWVKVPENQFKDNAGNGNIAEESTRISNVFADTTDPALTIYKDTEVVQDGQKITVTAAFSENVYNLVNNSRRNLSKEEAPKLIYGFGENGNLEASASRIDGNVITYVITKENTMSGEFYHAYFKGNVYDRAGNLCFKDSTDTIAPVLKSVEISSNAGKYAPYCKVGTEIYVIATFDEPIEDENMMLKAKVGEQEITELLNGEIVKEDNTKVKFTYRVKAGDKGVFEIVDISGNTDNTITEENADKTYGWVQDEYGNQNNIYNLSDEGVTVKGEAVADTKNPYITNIKAIVEDKEIAIYIKEEGKDAVVTVGRTKANIVEYIVTYSEEVPYKHFDKISITNGTIKSIEYTNSNRNEYKITVQTTVEGVQSLMINEGSVEDKAGNIDTFVRLDAVTVDFTKPTVRFISEYNGGVYVLPTSIGKVEIRTNVEINEEISKIEYKWDNNEKEDYAEITEYASSSDIVVPTKEFTTAGEHTLYIRVTDFAGNVTIASKQYSVNASKIEITAENENLPEDAEYKLPQTNGNVIVKVDFGIGLTDNRRVVFKAEGSNEYKEKVPNEDGTYTITENGYVYAEATDKVGNRVVAEEEIDNIDKEAPIIEFTELPYGILKNEPVEIYIFANEIANIKYSWDGENWETYENSITKTFDNSGEYTLYAKATDEAGNESTEELRIVVSSLDFDIYGNVDSWTAEKVELYVSTDSEITSIKVNDVEVNLEERIYSADENGDYVFVVTDKYGNTATKTEKVEKIDKVIPVISKVENTGKEITITATDEGSGIAKYAISTTTEVPVEWSESNSIKTTKDGTFYVWVKDKVGNIARSEEVVTVDTTAPIVTFSYLSQTVTVGMPLETNITTNENAIISYSWDKENWIDSEELISSLTVSEKSTTIGKATLYVKAKDEAGNESKVHSLEFNITNIEEIREPEIIFEDISTIQINGAKYVKVASTMTTEMLTDCMNKSALCGKNPEYKNLTTENLLKTGSEIAINGQTKYIVVVNGDVNCDGKVEALDVTYANRVRLGKINSNTIQKLAADFDLNGSIEAIDITMINRYRLGKIKGI